MTRTEIRASKCHHFLRRHSDPLFVLPAVTYDAQTPLCQKCQIRAMETAAIMEGMESMFVSDESAGDVNMVGDTESGIGRVDGGRDDGSFATQSHQQERSLVFDDDDLYKEDFPPVSLAHAQQHLSPEHHQQQRQCPFQHQHHRHLPNHQQQAQQNQTEDARLIELIASLTLYLPPLSQPQLPSHRQSHTQLLSQPQTQSQLLSHHLWDPAWPAPPTPTTPKPTTPTPISTPTSSNREEMRYDVYFSTLSLVHRSSRSVVQDQAEGVDAAERDARWRLYVQLRMCETGEQDFEVEEKRTLEMMREILARYG